VSWQAAAATAADSSYSGTGVRPPAVGTVGSGVGNDLYMTLDFEFCDFFVLIGHFYICFPYIFPFSI
jgi:uncharacterized protein YraI